VTVIDTVIVGGGQAGLATSYFLQQRGRSHVVFESGRIGESWLSQRWDSFQLNTLNVMNVLPGLPYDGEEPDGFWTVGELVQYLERYVRRFDLPVRTGAAVLSVEPAASAYMVRIRNHDREQESVLCRSVVIASGMQNSPKRPAIRTRLPDRILQLHTADYRTPDALPPGAVLVVGSGQSGCQITEDLLSAGRQVYLCTSKAGRAPRRYRGRDLLDWWDDMKHWEVTLASLQDKSIIHAAQPHISGVGRHGHTISLQQLARRGVAILGRLRDIEGDTLLFGDEASEHVRFADRFSQQVKDAIDAHIAAQRLQPPPLEEDPADVPDPDAKCASPLRSLSLLDAEVSTVIWATGFTGDFTWLHLPAFDEDGLPIHERGVSPLRGLYFVGLPWLSSRGSGIIHGVRGDARHIADVISQQLN
jgi:putative flavoprotein involved in K+ transport